MVKDIVCSYGFQHIASFTDTRCLLQLRLQHAAHGNIQFIFGSQ